ncbi:hypothetical protein CRUP_022225 [Coryphaenoides rupestris]|nr:hypothetical protein CRUP_022225 [Coryphaenoides rupestris]
MSSRWGNSGSRASLESLVNLGSPAGSKVINMPLATSLPLLAGRRGTQGSSGWEVGLCRLGSRGSLGGVARESERRGGIGGRRALRKEMVFGPRREETLPSEQSESRRSLETEPVSWGRLDDQPGDGGGWAQDSPGTKLVFWVEEEEVAGEWFSWRPEATGLSQPEREEEEEEQEEVEEEEWSRRQEVLRHLSKSGPDEEEVGRWRRPEEGEGEEVLGLGRQEEEEEEEEEGERVRGRHEEVVGEDVREAMRLQIPSPFWALILLLEVGGVWDKIGVKEN